MIDKVRKFALVVVDGFDKEIDRFNLDYADTPRNLGFELEFTTLESRLTTHFTSAREKKLPTTLVLNFIPPNAYLKVNSFKRFVQRYIHDRMVFEYYDTTGIKYWEGKVQKLDQEELTDWGGLSCPMSFLPGTPKYLKKDNTILVRQSTYGKSYPYKYGYSYGRNIIQNNTIENSYFEEIPLRVTLHGSMNNPQISLYDEAASEVYSTVRFAGLNLKEGEHLVIDAIQSKVLLWKDGKYISAYNYIDKQSDLNVFLHAKGGVTSKLLIPSLTPQDTGYLVASYRQYTL